MALPLLSALLGSATSAIAGTSRLLAATAGPGMLRSMFHRRPKPPPGWASTEDTGEDRRTPTQKSLDGLKDFARSALSAGTKMTALSLGTGSAITAINRLARASNDAAIAQLRTVSPAIAAIAARRDVFELQHGARRGKLVAGTTRQLADQIMQMRQRAQPFAAFGENLTNSIMYGFAWLADRAFAMAEDIGLTELIRKANKWFGAEEQNNNDVGHVLSTLNGALKNGLHNDPNLFNRRPNEKPGGRM